MPTHLGHVRASAIGGVALVDRARVGIVARVGRELAYPVDANVLSALKEIVAENRRRLARIRRLVAHVCRARVAIVANLGRRAARAVGVAHCIIAGGGGALLEPVS